jgi:ABC-type glycerol-3-phosphate transport system substrate-binding protein
MTSVGAVAALGLAAAACSSSTPAGSSGGGHVTISVNCEPPPTAVAQHKEWIEDVAIFEKANPNITIKSVTYTGQCEVPAQFTATLRAGTETNLFYAYFTDLHQVLDAGQAADITPT